MQWRAGQILRISNYRFEDDQSTRDKYSVVLFVEGNEAYLIHSLTTSQNNRQVPGLQYSCSVANHIPYYFIPQHQVIGDRGFSFEKDTFIFFANNVRKEPTGKFDTAAKTKLGLIELGILSNDELKRIIKCALKSKFLTPDVEKALTTFKAGL
jgi:hypothetical protein